MADQVLQDIYRGDTKRYKIQITGVDLSSDTFYLTCKVNADDNDASAVFQVVKSSPHADVGDDPTNGVVYIEASAANTALLTPKSRYYIGIQWVTSTGKVKTLIVDRVKCLQDITITS